MEDLSPLNQAPPTSPQAPPTNPAQPIPQTPRQTLT